MEGSCRYSSVRLYFAVNSGVGFLINHYQLKYVANRFVVNCVNGCFAVATPVLHSNDVPYMVQGSFALNGLKLEIVFSIFNR